MEKEKIWLGEGTRYGKENVGKWRKAGNGAGNRTRVADWFIIAANFNASGNLKFWLVLRVITLIVYCVSMIVMYHITSYITLYIIISHITYNIIHYYIISYYILLHYIILFILIYYDSIIITYFIMYYLHWYVMILLLLSWTIYYIPQYIIYYYIISRIIYVDTL